MSQARIDAFADATDDHQWIHVDPERAAAGPFGTTIAHGYLTLSLCAPLLSDVLARLEGSAMSINYGTTRSASRRLCPPARGSGRASTVASVEDVPGGEQAVLAHRDRARGRRQAGLRRGARDQEARLSIDEPFRRQGRAHHRRRQRHRRRDSGPVRSRRRRRRRRRLRPGRSREDRGSDRRPRCPLRRHLAGRRSRPLSPRRRSLPAGSTSSSPAPGSSATTSCTR